jgi:hypothetical protein
LTIRPKQVVFSLGLAFLYNVYNLKFKDMKSIATFLSGFFLIICFTYCDQKNKIGIDEKKNTNKEYSISFESQLKWGEHLVTILDCNVCHTPKKMTSHGPVLDNSLLLSGHPAEMPRIEIDRKEFESKGLTVALDFTEWIGPWGVSFAANLTPDDTGIGNWTEEQFILALREGKYKGLSGSRLLLPPMPWEMYGKMTDDEIKAIFAYLKSIKPISNIVPPPIPPVSSEN